MKQFSDIGNQKGTELAPCMVELQVEWRFVGIEISTGFDDGEELDLIGAVTSHELHALRDPHLSVERIVREAMCLVFEGSLRVRAEERQMNSGRTSAQFVRPSVCIPQAIKFDL